MLRTGPSENGVHSLGFIIRMVFCLKCIQESKFRTDHLRTGALEQKTRRAIYMLIVFMAPIFGIYLGTPWLQEYVYPRHTLFIYRPDSLRYKTCIKIGFIFTAGHLIRRWSGGGRRKSNFWLTFISFCDEQERCAWISRHRNDFIQCFSEHKTDVMQIQMAPTVFHFMPLLLQPPFPYHVCIIHPTDGRAGVARATDIYLKVIGACQLYGTPKGQSRRATHTLGLCRYIWIPTLSIPSHICPNTSGEQQVGIEPT